MFLDTSGLLCLHLLPQTVTECSRARAAVVVGARHASPLQDERDGAPVDGADGIPVRARRVQPMGLVYLWPETNRPSLLRYNRTATSRRAQRHERG